MEEFFQEGGKNDDFLQFFLFFAKVEKSIEKAPPKRKRFFRNRNYLLF